MITDPKELQRLTNKAICFHCGKPIDRSFSIDRSSSEDSPHYEIALKRSLLYLASSEAFTNNNTTGRGAYLRFHINCFEEVAGDDYMFSQEIWK